MSARKAIRYTVNIALILDTTNNKTTIHTLTNEHYLRLRLEKEWRRSEVMVHGTIRKDDF